MDLVCKKRSRDAQLYRRAESIIKNKLNIEIYLKLVDEFTKLKGLILTEDQLSIFNSLPPISLKKHIEMKKDVIKDENDREKLKDKIRLISIEDSEMNKKILDLLFKQH